MKKINFFLIGMTSVLMAFGMIGCAQSTGGSDKDGGADGKEIVSYTSGSYKLFINEILPANALELSANIYGGAAYSIGNMTINVQYNYRLFDSTGLISSGTVKKTAENLLQFKVRATGKTFSASVVNGTGLSFTSLVERDDGGTVSIYGTFQTPVTDNGDGNGNGGSDGGGSGNGGSGGSGDKLDPPPAPANAKNEAELAAYLNAGTTPIYVSTSFTVSKDLNVPAGKSIVITTNPPTSNTLVLSEGGSLFALGTPPASAPVLTVNGRLTLLGTGASIVLGSTSASTQSGKLVIGNTGKVLVTSGANITATTSSQIQLAAANSTLVFEDSTAKLNVVGSLVSDETVVGTAKAIVVIPSGTPNLTIGKENVAEPAKLGKETDYTDGPKLASATTPTAAKSDLSAGFKYVFYSGTEALIDIDIPNDATLIITGTVNQVTSAIAATGGTGKLEVAATGRVTTSAALPANLKNDGVIATTYSSLDYNGLKSLVEAFGSGTIVLGKGVGSVPAPLTLNQNLEIDTSGSITYTSGLTAFSASAAKKVTIKSNGKLILGDTITSLGNNVTVINEGTDPAAISTGNIDALGYILSLPSAPRNVTLSGDVSIVSGIKVKNGTTLTIAENAKLTAPSGKTFTVDTGAKVVVASGGTLDLSTLTVAGAVKLDGTIEVSGTLKVPAPESNGTTPEIAYGDNGNFKVNWGGAVNIGPSSAPYIGATSSLYTWTDTTEPATTPAIPTAQQYVTLKKNNETFLHGNLTTTNSVTVNKGEKTTIDKDATLTLGAAATATPPENTPTSRFFIDGEVIVSGTIKVVDAAAGQSVGWVELRDAASKLTLLPGGKLDIAAGSSVYTNSGTGESKPKVSVYAASDTTYATPTKAKNTGTSPNFVLVTEPTTGVAVDIILGNLKISITTAATPVTGANAGASAVKGTLTADPATAIVFAKQ